MNDFHIIFKHQFLPIIDLMCAAEIVHESKTVNLTFSHVDSYMIIRAARQIEEAFAPIRVIDDLSCNTAGRARIPDRYQLVAHVFGLVLDVEIVKIFQLKDSATPQFTVSMTLAN